jgi:ketosteroid isomerase-like protein
MVKKNARAIYRALSRRDRDKVVSSFAPGAILTFSGDHALGGTFEGREAIGDWFDRLFGCFPDLELRPHTIVVEGFPWNTSVATRFAVTATLPSGKSYSNEGMQFLRIRWGRVTEDRLYEDTVALSEALRELAEAGNPAATA